MTSTNIAAPGWYPDPSDPRQLRWYDGSQWTQSVHASAPVAQPAQAPPTQDQPTQGFGYQTPTYSQPQYGTQPAEQAMPQNGCQVCGATPAVAIHLRGHQGMILLMRFLSYKGQFCRDCGTAQFREVQRRTLLVGWWGYISSVANTVTALYNLTVYRKVRALGPPQGRLRSAKSPVASVFMSPGFAVTAALVLVLVAFFAS